MIFQKLLAVKSSAWWLLLAALIVALGPRLAWQFGLVDPHDALYLVQPVTAALVAGLAHLLLHGKRDRVRHKSDKAFIIASVLSVWFVIYFLSGLMLTFVHNAVASNWQAITINIVSFGVAVASVEYIRYALMLLAGRRNTVWFGIIVSAVFAVQQIGLLQISNVGSAVDVIKFVITYVMPAVVGSLLLTYISVSSGLGPQLAYSMTGT